MLKRTHMRMMKKDIKPAVYLQKIKNNYQWRIAIKNTEQFCEKISHYFLPIPITIINKLSIIYRTCRKTSYHFSSLSCSDRLQQQLVETHHKN